MPNEPVNNKIITEINYYADLLPYWEASPTTFGLNAARITQFKSAITTAQDNYTAAQTARKQAAAATTAQTQALRELRTIGRGDINTIKAFIENSGNESLWAQAGLQPPAPRGSVANPNPPFDITGTLDNQGNLTLKWKSSQPAGAQGTVYSIYRGLNNDAPTLLDTVGPRTFVDENVPAGTTQVTYYIKAKRSGKVSVPSANLQIRFGRANNGQLTISSVKMAA